jgi:hypothetical protein
MDRVQLDRDPALALEIHGVEELLPHEPLRDRGRLLDRRSASVDLPWSMWATMQKFRMVDWDMMRRI